MGQNENGDQILEQAKPYQCAKLWLTAADFFLTLILLGVLIAFPIHASWVDLSFSVSNRFIQLAIFFTCFSLFFLVFRFPLTFYGSYVLEKRFNLSNHTMQSWVKEAVKKELLSFALALLLIECLFWLIWIDPAGWWWRAWFVYAGFGIVLGQLFPVVIIPLFYQYRPLTDDQLLGRLKEFAGRYGMAIGNVYSLNLSKTTKKANAAFCGIGRTKRIVLSDTLLQNFTPDEIEVVLAHELGHFRRKDIWRKFAFGLVLSCAMLWFANRLMMAWGTGFGFAGDVQDALQFPLLCFLLFALGVLIGPLDHWFSRAAEYQADRFAIQATGNSEAFVSTMEKLGRLNLSDPEPHPVVEFLFYDHPALQKRIKVARHGISS